MDPSIDRDLQELRELEELEALEAAGRSEDGPPRVLYSVFIGGFLFFVGMSGLAIAVLAFTR